MAQGQATNGYTATLQKIEQEVQEGNPRVLRDIGTFLDKNAARYQAIELLKRYTLFTPREFVFDAYTSKQRFLDFYYRNEAQFSYSSSLRVFYLTPVEERVLAYDLDATIADAGADRAIRLRQHIRRLEQDIEAGNVRGAATQINRIAQLDMDEGYLFLLNTLKRLPFKKRGSESNLYNNMCEALVMYPKTETLKTMLLLAEKRYVSSTYISQKLALLTNIKAKGRDIKGMYTQYLDSLGSVKNMRQYGYDCFFDFKPYFFDESVDYYGRILTSSDSLSWVQHNAVADIKKTGHPRALYYLAAHIFQLTRHQKEDLGAIRLLYRQMRNLVAADIEIQNQERNFILEPDWGRDDRAVLNFLTYWAAHYNDYVWDDNRKRFINVTISQTLAQGYKIFFQRLNSTNDQVAWESYLKLTEGEPEEVVYLASKYKLVLDQHNDNLPPLRYNYLESLVQLTDYCRRNNILYEPTGHLRPLLQKLVRVKSPKDRYQLEQDILRTINVNDLTAIEYWGLLNIAKKDVAFSLGWILNRAYTKHWNAIVKDDKRFRLYLKKSFLFNNLGTEGISSHYLSKFKKRIDEDFRNRLTQLLALETDQMIRQQVGRLLIETKEVEPFTWKDLLETDLDLSLLPEPKPEEYNAITQQIITQWDDRTKLKLLFYMSEHANVEQVPYLIQLLRANEVQSETIGLLEKIYTYKFNQAGSSPKEQWLLFWQADSTNYHNWGRDFINIALNQLTLSPKLSIDDINTVTASSFFNRRHREICLESLAKVKPIRNIRRLKLEPKLSVERELKYLANIRFRSRELADLVKIVDIDNPTKLLQFFQRQLEDVDLNEQGSFYNRLFRANWLEEYLESDEVDTKVVAQLQMVLTDYLNNNKIRKSEREATVLNLARIEIVNKSLQEQLEYSFALQIDAQSKAELQRSILARVSYNDIPVALRYYNRLSSKLDYNFMQQDFGIPVFDLQSSEVRQGLIKLHRSRSAFQFYLYYLKQFGVDFLENSNKLDYQKVYDVLQYDLVAPLSGEGLRDYYVYGIVKILELQFRDNLGFHAKLNEDQTFYSYNSLERVKAWSNFLENRRFVKRNTTSPSFSIN